MRNKKEELKFCIIYFAAAFLTLIFWVLAIIYTAYNGMNSVMAAIIIIMTLCFVFFVVCGVLFLFAHLNRTKR